MQSLHCFPRPDTVQSQCLADCDDETEQLVVIELLVPVAAKVPAAHELVQATKPMRPASITSTGCDETLSLLRANDTARRTGWCFTATLAAPARAQSAARY